MAVIVVFTHFFVHASTLGERVIRFEFPETGPGALANFLGSLEANWFLTLLHYRNHGGQVGKVLAGVQVQSPPCHE